MHRRYSGFDIPNEEVEAIEQQELKQTAAMLSQAGTVAKDAGVLTMTHDDDEGARRPLIRLVALQVQQVTTKAVLGFPRDKILLTAEEEVSLCRSKQHRDDVSCLTRETCSKDIDVIVVGARGLSPIKKLLLGSVSSYGSRPIPGLELIIADPLSCCSVVSHAPCAVLVAKQPKTP